MYLESDPDKKTARSTPQQEQVPVALLEALREIIAYEFGKFEKKFQLFKSDICKTIENAKDRFESKLTIIAHKNDQLENWQMEHQCQVEQVNSQVSKLDLKTVMLDKAFRLLEKDLQQHGDDIYNIQQVVENLYNNKEK